MKRNLDVVRAILLTIEEQGTPAIRGNPSLADTEPWIVGAHLSLLIDAGLLRGIDVTSMDSDYPEYLELAPTWAGHEFLETVRDLEIWRRTKEGAGKVGSWSFALAAELAKGYAVAKARSLGLPV